MKVIPLTPDQAAQSLKDATHLAKIECGRVFESVFATSADAPPPLKCTFNDDGSADFHDSAGNLFAHVSKHAVPGLEVFAENLKAMFTKQPDPVNPYGPAPHVLPKPYGKPPL